MVLIRGRGRNVHDAASRGLKKEGNAISIWYYFFRSLFLFTPATQATKINVQVKPNTSVKWYKNCASVNRSTHQKLIKGNLYMTEAH